MLIFKWSLNLDVRILLSPLSLVFAKIEFTLGGYWFEKYVAFRCGNCMQSLLPWSSRGIWTCWGMSPSSHWLMATPTHRLLHRQGFGRSRCPRSSWSRARHRWLSLDRIMYAYISMLCTKTSMTVDDSFFLFAVLTYIQYLEMSALMHSLLEEGWSAHPRRECRSRSPEREDHCTWGAT